MLQRIQTIYLFISFLAAALLIFFPISSFQSLTATYELTIGGLRPVLNNSPNTIVLLVLTPILGILTFFTILKFKSRPLQLKLNAASLFVNMALLVAIFVYTDKISALPNMSNITYLPGAFFPIVSVLTIVLANRAIRKDEKMVKHSDRLR